MNHDQVRQQVYRIMSTPTSTPEEKRQKLLELGVEHLDVDNGHIVKIDQQTNQHEVIAASGSDIVQAGDETSLDQTFCRETITNTDVLTIYNAHEQGLDDDPAVTTWNIPCYIGTKLLVGNDLYGTLCFVSNTPRGGPISPAVTAFVDLLTSSISRLLAREHHETLLQRQQDPFELIADEIIDSAIFMLDPAGHIISWNKGAQRIKGYTDDEILGEHFSLLYPEADRAQGRPERLLQQARQTGRVEDEGWRVRKDDSQFWALVSITALYDEQGTLRGFGKVTRDLTERRTAEQDLEAERAFIDNALNALDDVFFVLTPDGAIDRVNQRAIEVTGYTEAKLTSLPPTEMFVPEDREAVAESIAEVFERGESVVEATLLTKTNERRRYEFRAKRLTDEDGTVTGVVGIGRDITRRTLYEDRLEVAQRVLRHNLRNDLTVVRGWAEMLADPDSSLDDDEAVEEILLTVDKLIELSEKTRRMADPETAAVESEPTVDVQSRVLAVVEEFRNAFPEATFDVEFATADGVGLANVERFETALRNTIENAIEHNQRSDPWAGVVVEQDAGKLQIHVHDNGPGIPAMEQRVIEAGEETPLEHGQGIGLWLIYWCVTTAGGELSFAEREPRGSTITLSFPLVTTT